jgi:hypothetical protein
MKNSELRRRIKKDVDRIPDERLNSLADYVEFLKTPPIEVRVAIAEKAIKEGRGVNWRKVRRDV